MHTFQMGTKFGVNIWICMTFHCYVLLQFSPTFTVVLEAGGTHACVPPAHIGQNIRKMVFYHSVDKINNFIALVNTRLKRIFPYCIKFQSSIWYEILHVIRKTRIVQLYYQLRPSNVRFRTLNRTRMLIGYGISNWMFTTSPHFFHPYNHSKMGHNFH